MMEIRVGGPKHPAKEKVKAHRGEVRLGRGEREREREVYTYLLADLW